MSSGVSYRDDILNDDQDKKRYRYKKKQTQNKSLLNIHFETVLILLRLKMNSLEKSLFLLLVLSFLMFVTVLNNYLSILKIQYPNIDKTTSTFSLMESLRYLDIAELLSYEPTISRIGTILCSVYIMLMELLYLTCLIDRFINPKSKARKYFFGRWFVNCSSFFNQLLSFPFGVIFLSYLLCTPEILGSGANQCSSSDQEYKIVFGFSLAGLILLVFSDWWIQIFFYNTKLYKKDATNIEREPIFLLEWSIYKWILTFFTAVKFTDSYAYYILFLLIEAAASVYIYIRINFTLASFTFANSQFHKGHSIAIDVLLALHLTLFLDEFCRVSGFYENTNERIILFLAIIQLLLQLVTDPLKEILLRHILFRTKDLQQLTSKQLIFKISLFQSLNSQTSTQSFKDALFKGIVNNHFSNPCPHQNMTEICFCRSKVLYDPKKRKDTPLDKIFLVQNNSIFTKFLIKSWFETYLFKHPNDYDIFLSYAEFLYFKMKNVSLALKNIAIFENKYISPLFQFRLFKLKATILKDNGKRNHDSYRVNQSDKDNRNKLEIESVIMVEEQISKIQLGIKFIIKNNIRFWAYLEKSGINLHEINQLAKFSLSQLELLKKFWKECLYYIDYRKKWRFYYCWYYLYILNKKIKVLMLERFNGTNNLNENDIFSEELQQENIDDDILSVHSNLKVDEMEKIFIKKVEIAFDKKNVIFNVNHESKGKILKVSRGIFHTFGYSQIELTGQVYIQMLMPRIFQSSHPTLMNNFSQTGKTKTLYSQRKVYCLNKQGCIFAAWKFVKQYVTLTGRCEYVAMIRPFTPPAGIKIYYIIANEDWEVDSMSDAIYEAFSLNPLHYQSQNSKLLLNLLVMCPKLIRYSKLSKYLTKHDYKLFSNRSADKHRVSTPFNNILIPQPQSVKGGAVSRFNLIVKFKKEQYSQQGSTDSTAKESSIGAGELDLLSPKMGTEKTNQIIPKTKSTFQKMQSLKVGKDQQHGFYSTQNSNMNHSLHHYTLNSSRSGINGENNQNSEHRNMMESDGTYNESIQKLGIPIISINSVTAIPPNMDQKLNINEPLRSDTTFIYSPVHYQQGQQGFEIPDIPIHSHVEDEQEVKLLSDTGKDTLNLMESHQTNAGTSIEFIEQANNGQNQQFFYTNKMRDQILKKKAFAQQQLLQQQSFSNMEDESLERDQQTSDFEKDSGSNLIEENEEEEVEYQKLDNLEKGDQINARIKLPSNFFEQMAFYHQKIQQVGKKISMNQELPSVVKQIQNKQNENSVVSGNKEAQSQLAAAGDQHDKLLYFLVRDTIFKYQLKKPSKEFSASFTASFKKINKSKVIILKITKFDEATRKEKTSNNENAQLEAKAGNSMEISSQKYPYLSLRSDLSEKRESIFSINNIGKLGVKNSGFPSDNIEELIAVKDIEPTLKKLNGMGYQLNSVISQEEGGSEKTLKAFHKDFVNRTGAKNISLGQSDNIYIKEDNHKPNKNIQTILNMRLFMRLFFLIIIVLNAFTFFYGPNYSIPVLLDQANKIFSVKNVLLSEFQAYNIILDQITLNQGHFSSALTSNPYWTQNQYQNLLQSQYNIECDYFYSISQDTSYKQTFFSKGISPYSSIEKNIFVLDSTRQEKYSLDTYDLFSKLIFSLQTLQEEVFSHLSLDLQQVSFLRQNTFPYIYEEFYTTQINLVSNLKKNTDTLQNFIIIIIIVESVLVTSSFIVLFRIIFVICNAFKSVIEVFPKISQRDLIKIKNYNIHLNTIFNYITEKDDFLTGTHPFFIYGNNLTNAQGKSNEKDESEPGKKKAGNYDLEEPSDGNENVGKKSKDIEDGGFLVELRMKIFTLYTIFVVSVVIFTGIFLFLNLYGISNLQLILKNGDVFMNTIGDNTAMMIAIKEKALDPQNYEDSFKPNIQSIINIFIASNMQPTIEQLSFVDFDDLFSEVYYGNPCITLSSLFEGESSTSQECSTIAQGSLGKGVASFGAFYKNAISEFVDSLNNDILDFTTIFEYNRGIYFVDTFQVYLMQIWSQNTENYLSNQLSTITAIVIIMLIALLIVYLIITEKLLLGRFSSEYSYFRNIYNMYMPDKIIFKEKRIKFWLVKHCVLNK